MAPNGYLHAATVIALADTSCGYGTFASLPEGARGFTTIELKSNFLGTVREGAIACEATLTHGGRTTQVWDARITDEATARVIALFRCTQILLYPHLIAAPAARGRQPRRGSARAPRQGSDGDGSPVAAARSTARAIRSAWTASSGVTAGVARPRTQSTKWRSSK